MDQTVVNIRLDDELKQNFDDICSELGLSMSSAINVFIRQVCREKRIPFEIALDPFYSEKNLRFLSKSIEQLQKGETVTKSLEELQAMENE